jgi:hypothetical protein
MNTPPPSGSNFRKEFIVPIVVSVIGGIILTTYQFALDKYSDKDDKTSIEQQVTVPTPKPSDNNAVAPDANKQKYVLDLNERIEQVKRLLRQKQCDEAQMLIGEIAWQHPELDENNALKIAYEKIQKKLISEAQLCRVADDLSGLEEKLEPEARKEVAKIFRQKSRNIDFAENNIELIEKKPQTSGDNYKITYTYQVKALQQGDADMTASVICSVPIIDGKPSDNVNYRVVNE